MYETKRDDVLTDFARYLKIDQGLGEKTVNQHKMMAAVFLDAYQDIRPSPDEAKEFQERMMDDGYSPSHINNTMKAVTYYFGFHGEEVEFTRLKRPKKLPETISKSQVRRMLYTCNTYRDYAILKTLASSGVRATELCDLNVTDADLDERVLRIQEGKFGKGGVARISQSCADSIESYLSHRAVEHDPLFLSRTNQRLTRSGLLQLVRRRARDANIEQRVTVHMFRHYFATSMIENGADISVVKELMRHEDITATMKYLHLSGKALDEQYDRYAEDL
ncbi:tyrosine-type recombinase/integrase [Haloferax marisrubri]|uniref:Integrase n=1 Tax=Haloferax marisrubri TaxID=1544719 RepID=A0A2P4NL07_9EURY|nr:tyrosine-type recombinase/integrase [Haloferax marisrubri]POG53816.1 integrase [Haloferax marisrubri]